MMPAILIRKVYTGPDSRLSGKTALVKTTEDGMAAAQFDAIDLTIDEVDLSHGWHIFEQGDFRVIPK